MLKCCTNAAQSTIHYVRLLLNTVMCIWYGADTYVLFSVQCYCCIGQAAFSIADCSRVVDYCSRALQ